MYRDRMILLLNGMINFVFSLISAGLIIRLFLRLFGANPSAGFTKFIYESTASLLTPFNGVFAPYVVEKGYVFEFSTLIAIVVYTLISWLLIEFITYVAASSVQYVVKK